MKRKNLGLLLLTLMITGCGSILLAISTSQMKASIQEELSTKMWISAPEGMETVENVLKEMKDAKEIFLPSEKDKSIKLFKNSKRLSYDWDKYDWNEIEQGFYYRDLGVRVLDHLADEVTAKENAKKIMDFICDDVDELLLRPYGINKSEYNYHIQRQYDDADSLNYGVFLCQNHHQIKCSIGIRLIEGKPILDAFARDGLIELAGSSDYPIPKEFLEENWSETTKKREEIYAEYLDSSKKIVAHLGLPNIIEEVKDVDSLSYFEVSESWSTVCFGYVLEDGTYVRVFYNRVNGLWDGFSICGYHEEYN